MLEIKGNNLDQAAAARQRVQAESRKGPERSEGGEAVGDKVSISSQGLASAERRIDDAEDARGIARDLARRFSEDGAGAVRAHGKVNAESTGRLLEAA